MKNILVILAAALIVALPFLFRRPMDAGDWRPGDPELVIISPHNEAVRYEFGEAFSRWHRAHYGKPVKLDWRVIGGTTEIMRYLDSEYASSMQGFWKSCGKAWPAGGEEMMLDRRFNPAKPPPGAATNETIRARFETQKALVAAFRGTDDFAVVSCGLDLFFGGGTYDHDKAARQGLTVPPWRGDERQRPEVVALVESSPAKCGGEIWRSDCFFGTVLSTFGICYNLDRLHDLGVATPPVAWRDLADPHYFGQLGLADPTKSGSIAKAFEMIVNEQCRHAVADAGFSDAQAVQFEAMIAKAKMPAGQMPTNVPVAYQEAIERGWVDGLNLLRLLGANARYFTDSAGKVPMDVSAGAAAAGVAIDSYGRFQAQTERAPDGTERMQYVTPVGGSSVSADPISLLRGAPHRELAVRFIEFALSVDGQKLWNNKPGTPGGPLRYALRRLPIRRDFYPSTHADETAVCSSNLPYFADALADPTVNPYALASQFTYQSRWTGEHFGIQRDLVRAMCMDSGDELRAAWRAILDHGGPEKNPKAMALLMALPDKPAPLDWRSAVGFYANADRLQYLREWTAFFRANYRAALAAAGRSE